MHVSWVSGCSESAAQGPALGSLLARRRPAAFCGYYYYYYYARGAGGLHRAEGAT
ncbi:MAG: hypothetical protein K6V36_14290 [Anaerolineae bacterium]|nr:hypothetical protein [Anaerolineae bacterium]